MRMRESVTSKTYDIWSRVYDHTFGRLVHRRQRRATEQLHLRPGDRVLDMGVGTGMTLPHYPKDVTVIGLDLSEGMLGKAADKRDELGLRNCHLVRADAMLPPFAEASFDHIMISHTVSVVSDPAKLMQWAQRLLRPGGRIVVLNHFQSMNPVVAWFEKTFNPIFVKIGWRSDLALEESLTGTKLVVEYCFQIRLLDLWKIVVLRHRRAGEPDVPTPHAAPRWRRRSWRRRPATA